VRSYGVDRPHPYDEGVLGIGALLGVLDLGIDLNAWPWIWLSIAVIFTLVELTVLAGTFILLPFAVSAFVAALAGFYDAPIEVQWAIFVFGGIALWIVTYRYVKRFMSAHQTPLGVGADRLVGMTAIVTAAIDPDDTARRGRIKVEGEVWGAVSAHDTPIAEHTRVRVVSVSGTRTIVEPVDVATPPAPPAGPPTGPPTVESNEPATRPPNTPEVP